jgi:excisionase family DNA binding protein/PAS domain S-box-containing protein
VNLKEAAARLGVHYQTAYRWVRAGELTAVRVGARYEVSDAAIHQFVATRQSVLQQAVPRRGAPDAGAEGDPEDLLLDLEAMAGDPLISVPALTNYAARRGSEVLGDLCLVAITAPDGSIERASIDHRKADRAAFVASALSVTGPLRPRPEAILASVLDESRVVRISHVPQDQLRAGLRPELRQYLADYPLLGILAAPISADGAVVGLAVFCRDTPAHPYTEDDEAFAVRFAARVGTLVLSAREIEEAWVTRQRVADRFYDWLAGQPLGAVVDRAAARALLEPDDARHPVVVFDPEGHIIGATKEVDRTSGYDTQSLIGRRHDEIVDPADVATELENFARLTSGELDYHDFHANRRRSDGTLLDYALHRVAVRHLDSTLACVISVGRPVRVSGRVRDLIGVG